MAGERRLSPTPGSGSGGMSRKRALERYSSLRRPARAFFRPRDSPRSLQEPLIEWGPSTSTTLPSSSFRSLNPPGVLTSPRLHSLEPLSDPYSVHSDSGSPSQTRLWMEESADRSPPLSWLLSGESISDGVVSLIDTSSRESARGYLSGGGIPETKPPSSAAGRGRVLSSHPLNHFRAFRPTSRR